MFVFTIVAFLIGFILYIIYGKDVDTFKSISKLSWHRLLIKFVYKLLKHRKQGILKIHKSLVYVAGCGDTDCTLEISIKNHKISVGGIKIDKQNLSRYKTVCGYDLDDGDIPICYPETLFIKPMVALITSEKFALSPIGLIHIRQSIKQRIPLQEYPNAELTAEAFVKQYREYDRGVEVDVGLRLMTSKTTCVWEGTMTLLSRGRSGKPKPRPERNELPDIYRYEDGINVPAECGVEYAKLSGDWNPHHLYPMTARLLGYNKPIAHGMWTLSRSIAQLQKRYGSPLDGQYEISCAFKRPLFMPGKAVVKYDDPSEIHRSECKVRVEEGGTGVPHLVASVRNLQ